jgi:hypothetical protein
MHKSSIALTFILILTALTACQKPTSTAQDNAADVSAAAPTPAPVTVDLKAVCTHAISLDAEPKGSVDECVSELKRMESRFTPESFQQFADCVLHDIKSMKESSKCQDMLLTPYEAKKLQYKPQLDAACAKEAEITGHKSEYSLDECRGRLIMKFSTSTPESVDAYIACLSGADQEGIKACKKKIVSVVQAHIDLVCSKAALHKKTPSDGTQEELMDVCARETERMLSQLKEKELNEVDECVHGVADEAALEVCFKLIRDLEMKSNGNGYGRYDRYDRGGSHYDRYDRGGSHYDRYDRGDSR